jgi:ferredoxin-NADP reductase
MTPEPERDPPGAHWQTATVTSIVPRTPTIKSFFFKLTRPIAFVAGQHVDVRLTAPDGYRAMRSYSIASSPSSPGDVELAIELLSDGEVSPFFHDTVIVGDTIELRGPLGGHFILPPGNTEPLLLAGGGSGLVPLMCMLRYRHDNRLLTPVALVLSARTWGDILYRDELFELERRGDGFTLALTTTREPPRRPNDYGRRVDAAMIADVVLRMPAVPRLAFVCGANPFVNAVADSAIAAGIDENVIRTERYGI